MHMPKAWIGHGAVLTVCKCARLVDMLGLHHGDDSNIRGLHQHMHREVVLAATPDAAAICNAATARRLSTTCDTTSVMREVSSVTWLISAVTLALFNALHCVRNCKSCLPAGSMSHTASQRPTLRLVHGNHTIPTFTARQCCCCSSLGNCSCRHWRGCSHGCIQLWHQLFTAPRLCT